MEEQRLSWASEAAEGRVQGRGWVKGEECQTRRKRRCQREGSVQESGGKAKDEKGRNRTWPAGSLPERVRLCIVDSQRETDMKDGGLGKRPWARVETDFLRNPCSSGPRLCRVRGCLLGHCSHTEQHAPPQVRGGKCSPTEGLEGGERDD